jgi:hypothetical protein
VQLESRVKIILLALDCILAKVVAKFIMVARWFTFKPKIPIWEFYVNLIRLVLIWHIFSGFDITYQEKSGNPG